MFTAELPDNVNQILAVHHSLWNHTPTIKYGGISYPTYTPSHEGYTSVILPNDNAKNFLWITQNLNKSSYATSEITKAQTLGHVKRITWIVDNNDNKFNYCGMVKTCAYFDSTQDIFIEKYIGDTTKVIYSSDPTYASYVSPQSRY